jgi:hypothetical protein
MSNNINNNVVDNKEDNKEDNIHHNIMLIDLTNKIGQITKSQNKNDFIKNYNEYQTKIKEVDEYINKPSTIDQNTDIKQLFEMLNKYNDTIHSNDITIIDYKTITDIVKLIEYKINTDKLVIKEINQ